MTSVYPVGTVTTRILGPHPTGHRSRAVASDPGDGGRGRGAMRRGV